MTGAELIVNFLAAQKVSTVFGIPGALNAHLYDAMARSPGAPRHVLVRHELGGAWMADGFARAGGDVGVVFTVPGPGASHAASAVAGAYTDCSRLLLITSQAETSLRGEMRRDLFHGLDQQHLFGSMTRWQTAVTRPDQLEPALCEAFVRLRSGRPGPVHLEVAHDVMAAEARSSDAMFIAGSDHRRAAPDDAVESAAQLLAAAARPVILAGDGVIHSGATSALGELASTLRAPVITTVMGKGALPDQHPWALGDMNSEPGSRAYTESDAVLALGVRFAQVDTRWPWFSAPRRLIHIDADAREIGRVFNPDVGIAADVRLAAEQLQRKLQAQQRHAGGWGDRVRELHGMPRAESSSMLLRALRAALPPDGIACFDVCHPGYRSRMEWECHGPHQYVYPGVYIGMGFGLPAGIGARLARSRSPVLVVAGDGGFQMTMAELGTAVQHDVPLVIVVVNDAGLSLIRAVQDRSFEGRRYAVDLVNPSFTALAAAYGVESIEVREPGSLEEAARAGFEGGRLTLIEYTGNAHC